MLPTLSFLSSFKHIKFILLINEAVYAVDKDIKWAVMMENRDRPLIMLMSLAPSPMANVTVLIWSLIQLTIIAFCSGVSRQQMTARQRHATSRNNRSSSMFPNMWTYQQGTTTHKVCQYASKQPLGLPEKTQINLKLFAITLCCLKHFVQQWLSTVHQSMQNLCK